MSLKATLSIPSFSKLEHVDVQLAGDYPGSLNGLTIANSNE